MAVDLETGFTTLLVLIAGADSGSSTIMLMESATTLADLGSPIVGVGIDAESSRDGARVRFGMLSAPARMELVVGPGAGVGSDGLEAGLCLVSLTSSALDLLSAVPPMPGDVEVELEVKDFAVAQSEPFCDAEP